MQWNKRNIELPICSEDNRDKGEVNEGWIPKLYYFQRLFSKKQLWEEIAIIQRILYKNTLQHRKSSHLRKLIELSRCLKRFKELNLAEIFNHIIPTKTEEKNIYNLPSREMVSYFLTRLVGGYKLLSKTVDVLEETYISFHAILRQALFMPFALIVMSSTSRLHIYFQYLLKEMNLCYKMTYHWMSTLKQVKNKEFEIGLTENIEDIFLHAKSIQMEYQNYQFIQNAIDLTTKDANNNDERKTINENENENVNEKEEAEEEEEEEKPIIIEETNNELSSSFWEVLGSKDKTDDIEDDKILKSTSKTKKSKKSKQSNNIKENNKINDHNNNSKALKQKKKNSTIKNTDDIIDNIFDSLPTSLSNKKSNSNNKNNNNNNNKQEKSNKLLEENDNDDDDTNGIDLIDKLFNSIKDNNDITNKNNKHKNNTGITNRNQNQNLNNNAPNNKKEKKKKRKFSDINEKDSNKNNKSNLNSLNNNDDDDIDMIFSGKITTKTVIKPLDKLKLNHSNMDQDINNYTSMNKKLKKNKKNKNKNDNNNDNSLDSYTDNYLEKVLKHQKELKDEEERQNNILDLRIKEMKKNKKLQKKKKKL
ncbi:hypothetical protein BCR32DRAFT_288882 [Anaeromyces robustus]|uniref:Nucleolus and neural progenitor protein-like N-terminal domain-containing protein n=1 Tax=Anaeromyces robustus TaxID=1754192 RepID=A0A1Y1XR59_9FUNG|nr:hypothetical protein BCR32DRAFT_288882 [Anaeromyces robustus]|eukprot:ORX88135.1 hypothetical protein BCR32DRAFT_288882 [Anaeromyces robustus]